MLTCLKLKHYINQNDWNTSYITFDVCRDSMKNHYMHITEPSWTELNGALVCSSKKHKIIYISNTYRCVRTRIFSVLTAHIYIVWQSYCMYALQDTPKTAPSDINWVLYLSIFLNNLYVARERSCRSLLCLDLVIKSMELPVRSQCSPKSFDKHFKMLQNCIRSRLHRFVCH